MKQNIWSRVIVWLAAIAVYAAVAGPASAEIRLGVLPRLSATELYGMFTPLANYLTQESGEKVSIIIPRDFDGFKSAVKNNAVDMGFSNPIVYVQLKKEANVDPLALSAEQKAGTKFRGIIIARKDGGVERLQDLKGKRLVFVEKDSAGGYIFQMLLLTKAGLDIHKDFTTLPFAKKHDNVIMAVFNKAADAGGVREDDLDKVKDRVDLSQLKIVGYTDYFPNWPMFAGAKMNKAAAAKIKAALLKLTPNNPESDKILGPAKLAGFVPVADKDYDLVRQAAKLAGAL